ncbi:MAG: MFS transporter [Candidatus Kapaibacteriota bacterium]|jgi:MFS family permease
MERTKIKTLLSLAIIFFFERFAYTNLLIQLPIYIAQKGISNTLGWGQEVKGWIFFFWALVQNLTPIYFGVIADKISPRKAVLFALLFASIGYLGLLFSNQILTFILFILLLGFGSGAFKPSIQGLFSEISSQKVWAVYLFISNIAFLSSLFCSKILKDIGWKYVIVGSLAVSTLNLFFSWITLQNQNKPNGENQPPSNLQVNFKEVFRLLQEKRTLLILGFTTCFALIYMQFYETLPNFIVDWVDTSKIVSYFNLPNVLTIQTSLGKQLSYEILYILNPFLIIAFVGILQKITENQEILNSTMIGLSLVVVGFFFCGFTMNGVFLLIGITIYTFGEMLFNMKILEIISKSTSNRLRSTYFGVLNISYTIGLTIGAITGGYLYRNIAEKHTLATKYLGNSQISNPIAEISRQINNQDPTGLLWDLYKPYIFWLPFLIAGIAGIVIVVFLKKYKSK